MKPDESLDYVDGPGVERNRAESEEVVRRRAEEHDLTPRRYEQDLKEDDPVMPSDDPSLGTKI